MEKGEYLVYADITHEDGYSHSVSSTFDIEYKIDNKGYNLDLCDKDNSYANLIVDESDFTIKWNDKKNIYKTDDEIIFNFKVLNNLDLVELDTYVGMGSHAVILNKEKEYVIARQKIELSLESFYRSAASLAFQLNKRHITRNMSIFRCIDRRFETGEIFIKWDEATDEEWLLLIYIKNNSPDEGIVIEDKTNPEKNLSHEFKSNEIFKASDLMVDSLTQLIAKKREKKE